MKIGEVAGASPRHDVIVVGSGVAGLRAAIEAAEAGLAVALLAKDTAHDSNTDLAQGGVAVALSDEDQVGLHYTDTLAAGDGLCDESAVSILVGEGPRYITQLIDWGAQFDREGTRLAFTQEAAHSARRILHAHGDSTGRELLRTLWRKASTLPSILFLPHTYSVDLIVRDGVCRGLEVLDETTEATCRLESEAVVLATGGAGQVYLETTNPPQATGDGIAIAWRAGAMLRDMEFVQFHPTSLHIKGAPRFLLSEALRGEGGLLKNSEGRRFVFDADPRGELAPRDIVARSIFQEMSGTNAEQVYLDLTHLDAAFVKRRFPRIHSTCARYGIDMTSQAVPVAPAAHYLMGGVSTDHSGRTTLPGLYAAGEAACTGVHGANRLASNSLLEGLVFGARTGIALIEDRGARRSPAAGAFTSAMSFPPERAAQIISEVRRTSWRDLGIVRSARGLAAALGTFDAMLAPQEAGRRGPGAPATRPGLEAANMATVARLIAGCALERRESRGGHFRADYPHRDDVNFGKSSLTGQGMAHATFGPQEVA